MNAHVELKTIMQTIGLAQIHSRGNTTLTIPPLPEPYVAPQFRIISGNLEAEVISIQAPAAVGKSVTARHISATKRAPLLNLATVPVGRDSLQGMLATYSSHPALAIAAFHRGDLPIVIDAIDEGVLLSGEPSMEAFLDSTIRYLLEQRTKITRPKIILLGRDDSINFSKLVIEMTESDIQVCQVRLDFFDREAALTLMPLYALWEIQRLARENLITDDVHVRRKKMLETPAMQELLEAYFEPIETTLGIEKGKLWQDEQGRAFAGYAPTLASIGTLLAQVDNPIQLTNKLRQPSSSEAWDVIATVIDDILEREQAKFAEKLNYSVRPQGAAYAPHEQLTYLVQVIHGRPIELLKSLDFDNLADRADYQTKVEQMSSEHPFIRSSKIANEVLGSRIVAHAVSNDLLSDDPTILRELSRQPFLWRFLKSVASRSDLLLDGRYLGCLLHSYWNDPIEPDNEHVAVKAISEHDMGIHVTIGNVGTRDDISFTVTSPASIYARIRNCEIDIPGLPLTIDGSAGGAAHFQFMGDNTITCGELMYSCETANISGTLWLDADTTTVTSSRASVSVEEDSKYGWGEATRHQNPWRILDSPKLSRPQTVLPLLSIIYDCKQRIRGSVVVVSGFKIPENETGMDWAMNEHGELFSEFLRLLVESKLVTYRRIDASGSSLKFRIQFRDFDWHGLTDAIQNRVDGLGANSGNAQVDLFIDACVADGRFGL